MRWYMKMQKVQVYQSTIDRLRKEKDGVENQMQDEAKGLTENRFEYTEMRERLF